jgi:hypothetical protein
MVHIRPPVPGEVVVHDQVVQVGLPTCPMRVAALVTAARCTTSVCVCIYMRVCARARAYVVACMWWGCSPQLLNPKVPK